MKIRTIMAMFALFAIAMTSFPVSAQISVKTIKGKDRVIFKKKTVIDFEDSTVEGELAKPEQSAYTVRGRAKFNSLIRYRAHFVREMWKTARNL